MKKVFVVFLLYCTVFAQNNQLPEIMSETPLHPIPEEMTYEEYQDMNRRMNIGIGLAFIPIPALFIGMLVIVIRQKSLPM